MSGDFSNLLSTGVDSLLVKGGGIFRSSLAKFEPVKETECVFVARKVNMYESKDESKGTLTLSHNTREEYLRITPRPHNNDQ